LIGELNLKIQFFGDKSEVASVKQHLLSLGIKDVTSGLAGQAVSLAKNVDQLQAAADAAEKKKKADEDYQKGLAKAKSSIVNDAFNKNVDLGGQIQALRDQIQYGRELTDVEQQQITNFTELIKKQQEWRIAGFTEADVTAMSAILTDQQAVTLELVKQLQVQKDRIAAEEQLKQHLKDWKDFQQTIQDQVDEIQRGGKPLTVYEETLKKINEDFSDMDEAQKAVVLSNAVWIDSVKALQAEYDKVRDQIRGMLDDVLHGDFKNLGRTLLDQARNAVSDRLSTVFTNIIFGGNPHETNNPVAKPIVKEITGTNKRLDQVIKLLGGAPGATGLGGGLGSIISGINGGSLGGLGTGGTVGGGSTGGSQGGVPVQNRGILSQIFGKGGLFGDKGFGNNLGTYQGIGALGSLAGGLVGGRVGGLISSTASGLGIGAQIGSLFGPVGTAVGAVVGAVGGFLVGLFGFNDPKKKADKEQNIPALQKGFADSMAQLNKILDDMRHLNIDPDDAINQATAIRADIAGGFGIQFQSKKYRKQSQQMIASGAGPGRFDHLADPRRRPRSLAELRTDRSAYCPNLLPVHISPITLSRTVCCPACSTAATIFSR
jgi:hypothetical protein